MLFSMSVTCELEPVVLLNDNSSSRIRFTIPSGCVFWTQICQSAEALGFSRFVASFEVSLIY